jgi:hypothetical protein
VTDEPTTELRLALAFIEEQAEERHMLHGDAREAWRSNFWNCSRSCCKKAAEFLRGKRRPFCKARAASTAGGNDPQDCNWPWCGCDPLADRVLAAIQEQGLVIVKEGTRP